MLNTTDKTILEHINQNPLISSKEIYDNIVKEVSYATIKRTLGKLVETNLLESIGKGRGTKYQVSPAYDLFSPINIDTYFEKEIDNRKIKEGVNLKYYGKSYQIFKNHLFLI